MPVVLLGKKDVPYARGCCLWKPWLSGWTPFLAQFLLHPWTPSMNGAKTATVAGKASQTATLPNLDTLLGQESLCKANNHAISRLFPWRQSRASPPLLPVILPKTHTSIFQPSSTVMVSFDVVVVVNYLLHEEVKAIVAEGRG